MRLMKWMWRVSLVAVLLGLLPTWVYAKDLAIPVTETATAKNDAQSKTNRSLCKFDLPSELDDVLIDRAVLKVRFDTSLFIQDVMLVRVYPLIESWSSGARALSDRPSVNDTAGVVWVARRSDNRDAEIDIFPIVHDWISGRYPNYGLVIEPLVDSDKALIAESPGVARGGEQAVLEVHYRTRGVGVPGLD